MYTSLMLRYTTFYFAIVYNLLLIRPDIKRVAKIMNLKKYIKYKRTIRVQGDTRETNTYQMNNTELFFKENQ